MKITPLLIVSVVAAAHAEMMPLPAKVVMGKGSLAINSDFRAATRFSDARLERAIARFHQRLALQTGLPLAPARTVLSVDCNEHGPAYPELGEDESYQLDVDLQTAHLQAHTVTGALRGLETFLQLVSREDDGYHVPVVHIEDHPRYVWRGLMLDVSRHWMPLPVVERNLDAMAAVKMNVFHWHLSDDQGFRVESKKFPKLQELASDGNFYTQQQVREVVDYARDRGIRVVPEFDMPGHASALLTAYPELASAPGSYHIERKWGIFQPTIDPTSQKTYGFLEAFLEEMSGLFPDRFFHIGGDEVEPTQWKESAAIQAFIRDRHIASLHAYFNQQLQRILKKNEKTLVGWDEILDPTLETSAVIQSWRGADSLSYAAAKGYRGILSYGFYLDHLRPASYHYAMDPGNALGGEACMWTEYVNAETVDSRIWPRAAAIAERFWSARDVTDVADMYSRLEPVSRQLTWTGILHRSNLRPLLDRIAPGDSLQVLAAASESTGIEQRRDARHYTSLVPLNRFVDAVPPESDFIRSLEPASLHSVFTLWAANKVTVPELIPLSTNLAAVGSIGLAALNYMESGSAIPEDWKTLQLAALDKLDKPVAEVNLAAIRVVRRLLSTEPLNRSKEARSIR
jgi:hexosaminidase